MPRWNENPRILFSALLISAALNLSVAGYFISHFIRSAERTHDTVMHERMEGLLTLLPQESRPMVRDDLNAQAAAIRHNLSLIRKERRHILKLIHSENLTMEELNLAFAKLRGLHGDTQRIYHEAFSKAVSKLPLEQRKNLDHNLKMRHHMAKKPKPTPMPMGTH